jgi:hypothetical protein
MGRSFWVLSGLLLILPPFASAEVVLLRDGRRLPGTLTFAENRLQVMPVGQQTPLSLEDVHAVLFPSASGSATPGICSFALTLADEQHLHGEFFALDERQVQFRPSWGNRGKPLAIPREAVHAVTQPEGYLLLMHEDFETDLSAWKVSGSAILDEAACFSGRKSLLMRGTSFAELPLGQPLASGKVTIYILDDGSDTRGFVELAFQTAKGARRLRCVVGGDPHYHVEADGRSGERRLPRRTGWHGLAIAFAPGDIRVLLDERVLWAGRLQEYSTLLKVRLECVAATQKAGGLRFDDLLLARAVEPLRHPEADPLQDEVWLASADQVLGHVLRADRRTIELDAKYGKRAWPWSDVRGVYFRHPRQEVKKEPGRVRLWLGVPGSEDRDQLVGQVHGLSDRRLSLHHGVLGDLEIERAWIRRIAAE